MLQRSLGKSRKVVWVADPSLLVSRAGGAAAPLPPLADDERFDLVRFLIIGERVTARMASECGELLHTGARVALADIASETNRFDAMLCHYLARRGHDARVACGSLEIRALALLRDRLGRMDTSRTRIGFLNALQEGVVRRLRSELPRIQDDVLARALRGLLAELERRCRRTLRIRRNLARPPSRGGEGTEVSIESNANWSGRADDANWTSVH